MTDITVIIGAASAIGLVSGIAIGFGIARPWQDWTIKRINRDRADLRRDNDRHERIVAALRTEVTVLRVERNNANRQLLEAGKPDQQRDPKTGRWLSNKTLSPLVASSVMEAICRPLADRECKSATPAKRASVGAGV